MRIKFSPLPLRLLACSWVHARAATRRLETALPPAARTGPRASSECGCRCALSAPPLLWPSNASPSGQGGSPPASPRASLI
eukprot:6292214-Prymnesium_polylepis.1